MNWFSHSSRINAISLTVGLIALMLVLAWLQYEWLSRVSEAQEKQLKASVQAAAINMGAAFDRQMNDIFDVLSSLRTDSVQTMATEINQKVGQLAPESSWFSYVNSVWIYDSKDSSLWKLSQKDRKLSKENSESEKKFWVSRLQSNRNKNRLLEPFESAKIHLDSQRPYISHTILASVMSFDESTLQKKQSKVKSHSYAYSFNQKQISSQVSKTEHVSNSSGITLFAEINKDSIQKEIALNLPTIYLGNNYAELYQIYVLNSQDSILFHSSNAELSDSIHKDATVSVGTLKSNAFLFFFNLDDSLTFQSNEFQHLPASKRIETFRFTTSVNDSIKTENRIQTIVSTLSEDDKTTDTSEKKVKVVAQNTSGITKSIVVKSDSENDTQANNPQLVIQSNSVSIEQYVKWIRLKNLSVSFGILFVLSVALVLLIWNAQKAHEMAHQKMEFVAGISHELKTPLAVIRTAASNVKHGIVNKPEQMEQYGNLIESEGQRLSRMVDQILDFAGIQSGSVPINKQKISFSDLGKQWEKHSEDIAKSEGFELEWFQAPKLPEVELDVQLAESSFQNLFQNAIKYSDKEKRIQVRLYVTEIKSRRYLAISVQDFGMGISHHDQKSIFKPFFRTQFVRNEQIRGNGLGLYLVKRWMKAQGGKIDFISKLGQGSTFTLYFLLSEFN